MPTYKTLKITNPQYDAVELLQLRCLYDSKKFEENKAMFLQQRPAEPDERYRLRLKEASYRNYIGPIIDFFASMLFSTRPNVAAADKDGKPNTDPGDFYSEFKDDCDGIGTNIDALFKRALIDAAVCRVAWVRVLSPDDEGAPAENAAEFSRRKLGDCTIQRVDPENVIDWETDDSGALQFVVIHETTKRRASIEESRDATTETWTVLYQERVDTYAVRYEPGSKPNGDDSIKLISSKSHGFGAVPMIKLDVGEDMHVAGRLKSPQLAHFRKSNALSWSISTTCFAQPVFTLMDRNSMPTMGAGYGIIIGKDESMTWAAPPTGHFAAISTEVKDEKDEIFRISHQMALGVENNAAAVGRSGESKQQDAQNTRVMLLAFSRVVKEAIEKLYDMMSRQRDDQIKWSVSGLDDFAALDIGGMLENLKSLDAVGGINSEIFLREIAKRLADSFLPDISQEERVQMHKQIQDAVSKRLKDEKTIAEIARAAGARAEGGPGTAPRSRGGGPVPPNGPQPKGPPNRGKRGNPGGSPVRGGPPNADRGAGARG